MTLVGYGLKCTLQCVLWVNPYRTLNTPQPPRRVESPVFVVTMNIILPHSEWLPVSQQFPSNYEFSELTEPPNTTVSVRGSAKYFEVKMWAASSESIRNPGRQDGVATKFCTVVPS
jgi:hypothetical protein